MTFHASAWSWWLASAVVVVLAVDQPVATALALAALAFVAAATPVAHGATAAGLMFKVGLFFVAARVLLFGVTGHTGPTTLVVLPAIDAPAWLGGFQVGGRITAEVVTLALAEGLKVAAVLAAFGVFMAAVPVARVMRSVPRFLHEAGLVVGIALTFVPVMLRTAAEIRDAQRMRGHRFRGVRSLRALVVPVLAGAMERSIALAASMDARGYGRAGPRTRYRPDVMTAWDIAMIASAVAAVVLAIAARTAGAGSWYPYPVARMPQVHALALAPALLLLSPPLLAALRGVRLARASRHVAAEVAP